MRAQHLASLPLISVLLCACSGVGGNKSTETPAPPNINETGLNFSIAATAGGSSATNASTEPFELAFASQVVNTTSPARLVMVSNTGNTTVTVSSISLTGSSEFKETNTCGAQILAGGICSIFVTFRPTAEDTENGILTVNTNSSGYSPVSLSGTGIAGPAVTITGTNGGHTGTVQVVLTATSNFGIAQVVGSLDGVVIGTLTAPNYTVIGQPNIYYAFSINTFVAGSGSHLFSVQVTDGNGVTADDSLLLEFNNPPILTVTSEPTDGSILSSSFFVSGQASTDKPAPLTTTVLLGASQCLQTTAASFSVECSVSGLTPGDYNLEITAKDSTGVSTSLSEVIGVVTPAQAASLNAIGPAGTLLLATNSTDYLYQSADGSVHLHAAGSDSILQSVPSGAYDWLIMNGDVFALAGSAYHGTNSTVNLYAWQSNGTAVSPIALTIPALVDTSTCGTTDVIVVCWASVWMGEGQDGWLLVGNNYNEFPNDGTYTPLYGDYAVANAVNGQVQSIPIEVAQSVPNTCSFFVGVASSPSVFCADPSNGVRRWDLSTGTTTSIAASGATPHTDGTWVAWTAGTALWVESVSGGTATALTQHEVNYFVSGGVVAWMDNTPSGGGIMVYTASGKSALTNEFSSVLQGASGGYVLYQNNGNEYLWSQTIGPALFLFPLSSPILSGAAVYFSLGQLTYQAILN